MRGVAVPQQPTTLVETIDMGLVQGLISMWQQDLGELSPVTRASYRRGAASFFDWLAEQDQPELSYMTVRTWLSGLSALGYRPGSVNTWLVGLRSFFVWAHEQGYIPFNPALGIRGIRVRGTTRAVC